jgi:hypothetical protein
MAGSGGRPSWWRRTLGLRVMAYLIILVVLLAMRQYRSASPPQDLSDLPTRAEEGRGRKDGGEAPVAPAVLGQAYPQVRCYAWSLQRLEDGRQEIRVLVKFERNVENLEWRELVLRSAAGKDLAEARAPVEQARPALGLAQLVFLLPPGLEAFKAGRIWCWNQYLEGGELEPGRKVLPSQIEEGLRGAEGSNHFGF